MSRIVRFVIALAAVAADSAAIAEVVLTANVYDTPGLPGFRTYDITASSPVGYLNGFSFYEGLGGVTGPLYQVTPGVDLTSSGGFVLDSLFAPNGALNDSHWLVPRNDGVHIGASQSVSGLYGAYTFMGASALRNSLRSMPLARLVTNTPAAVSLSGDFVVEQFWNDDTALGPALFSINTLLSDIMVGTAPVYDSFPNVPDDVLAERRRQRDAEAEWQAAVAAQERRREEARQRYERQIDTEQTRLEELARLAAEQAQTPTKEIPLGGGEVITFPLDPPSVGEEDFIITIDHPHLSGEMITMRPTHMVTEGGYTFIDLVSNHQIDWQMDFTPPVFNEVDFNTASVNDSAVVFRGSAEHLLTTFPYAADAMTFSTSSLSADSIGTTATPEPGVGLLGATGLAPLVMANRRLLRH